MRSQSPHVYRYEENNAAMDLNNLYYFAVVVEKQSFSAAAEAVGMPKGTLSKRIRSLEETLGLRLANRTTRRFSLTEAGVEFYSHCLRVLDEVRAAERAIGQPLEMPVGRVRISCTAGLVHMALADLVPKLQSRHPGIELEVMASGRYVDLVSEGFDFALRNHTAPLRDTTLVVRRIAQTSMVLVASPSFFPNGLPSAPAELEGVAAIALTQTETARKWELHGPDDARIAVEYRLRMSCNDALMVRSSVLAGTGVAALPSPLCRTHLAQGHLLRVLPEWNFGSATLSIAQPSRRGVTPAVRTAIDFLASELPDYLCD
jgi:DNA-binding transcriptional LysR family regulator